MSNSERFALSVFYIKVKQRRVGLVGQEQKNKPDLLRSGSLVKLNHAENFVSKPQECKGNTHTHTHTQQHTHTHTYAFGDISCPAGPLVCAGRAPVVPPDKQDRKSNS